MTLRRMTVLRPSVLVVSFLALLLTGPPAYPRESSSAQSQEPEKPAPFALDDLLALLAADVTPARLTMLVKERGVSFDFTPDAEQKLRLAGADDALLLEVAKAAARRPPPPKPEPKPEPPAPPPAPVDRAKLVLEKAIEAMGGVPALESYHRGTVVVFRSTLFTPQGETSLSGTAYVTPDKFRLDMTTSPPSSPKNWQDLLQTDQRFVFVYDGQRAWQQVGNKVDDLPPIEAEIARRILTEDPDQLLLGVYRGSHSVQFLETRTIEGRETEVLAIITSRGEQVKLFVEASTGRILRSIAPELVSSGEIVECETNYSDFRRIGPYTLPFHQIAWHNGVKFRDMVFTSAQFNTGLDPALFIRPERPKDRPRRDVK